MSGTSLWELMFWFKIQDNGLTKYGPVLIELTRGCRPNSLNFWVIWIGFGIEFGIETRWFDFVFDEILIIKEFNARVCTVCGSQLKRLNSNKNKQNNRNFQIYYSWNNTRSNENWLVWVQFVFAFAFVPLSLTKLANAYILSLTQFDFNFQSMA